MNSLLSAVSVSALVLSIYLLAIDPPIARALVVWSFTSIGSNP